MFRSHIIFVLGEMHKNNLKQKIFKILKNDRNSK